MTFRVLSAEISHETNTFSIRPTDLAAFRAHTFLDGRDAVAARGDANTELAGLRDVARAHGWSHRHAGSAMAGPGGRVTEEAFEAILAPLLDAAGQGWDGIALLLHGAMVTETHEDGEGEILARLRAIFGLGLPVAVTLDPHANVTAAMCERAQILVSHTTYPHVDTRATGRRAAELLHHAMTGAARPHTVRVQPPMLEEANGGRTDMGPMIERQALARAFEARPEVLAVSINGGFPNADILEAGPTVLVCGTGDTAPLEAVARELTGDVWDRRREVLNRYLSVGEAARMAAKWRPGAGPLVIADYADNPGAGAYGDATALLSALLEAGVEDACFGPLVDPEAARALQREEVGAEVALAIGGRTAPGMGGGPLQVTGTVRWTGPGLVTGSGSMMRGTTRDFGPTAVLRVGGIDVLVVSLAHQMLDLEQFRAFGIDPAARGVVALKSMQHFRAAFGPIAGRIAVCDSGALCTQRFERMPYRNVRRPIWPLDDV